MLNLNRRKGGRVWIGDVCVIVTRIGRSKVQLGIEAPRGVEIMREESLKINDPRRDKPVGKS
jgi:carbon storage regulator CsrA